MRWFLCSLVLITFQPSAGLYVEIFTPTTWKVMEDTDYNLTLSLRLNSSDVFDASLDPTATQLEVVVTPDEEWKLDFVSRNLQFSLDEVLREENKSVAFSGYYWGRTRISLYLLRNDLDLTSNATLLRDDLYIIVDRKALILDYVFIGVGSVFMLFNNVNMGAQLDLEVIVGVLKRPLGPACGFLSQFVCMPVVSFLLGWAFFTNPLDRLGLFTLGCCPGGTMSNFWTLMYNGDINLSITMTAVSTVAAMGMMPLWMFTLGQKLLSQNSNVKIPFGNLAGSLISLTVPVIIGIFIKHKRPDWAKKGSRIIKPVTFAIILFFMTIGIFNSYKAFMMMTWEMPVAGIILAFCGYAFGAVFATLWCLSKDKVIAISIETALQNPGVAFILLKLSLPSPDSDLATLPVVATIMMTGPPLMVVYAIILLLRRFTNLLPDKKSQQKPLDSRPKDEKEERQEQVTVAFLPGADQAEYTMSRTEGKLTQHAIVLEGLTKKKLMET
ncbi:ileal sodium/bile acid cotransporter-like [Penaeus indicus]|uniref:ileal sodium/bile acid cotransporter-like n=1 Tax=Penaeus indicus TaxID=29960 RepID=UPI00300D302E